MKRSRATRCSIAPSNLVLRVLLLVLFARATPLLTAADLRDWKANWERRTSAGVYALRQGDYVRVGNEYLERVLRLSEDSARTVRRINKVSGKWTKPLDQPEFSIAVEGVLEGFLEAPDFRVVDINVVDEAEGALRTSLALECRRNSAFQLTEVFETYPHRRYQRQWLMMNWTGEGDLIVKQVDVQAIVLAHGTHASHYGYGQPVFVDDQYFGLEYPGAETGTERASNEYVYLRHYPGRSAKGGLKSKTAIWGVAADPSHVRQAFFHDYLASLHPIAPQPFVLYNLLGLGAPDAQKLSHWVGQIAAESARAGLPIDSYVIDDGWQDLTTVWKPDQVLFPGGFASLIGTITGAHSRLGLWMSLHGATLDTEWGSLRGLEVAQIGERGSNGRYCIAAPNYHAALKQTLRHYVVDDGVNYFKFDYNTFQCNVAGHGHPAGRASKDALIDAYIDVLQYVKSLDPRVRTAITSGMWLSPWWTLDCDWVWLGGSDGGSRVASVTPADSRITYRDTVMYEDYREKEYVFPYSSLMTHGFWVHGNTPFEQYQEDCLMTIGRGITDWEILTSPKQLDAKRYEFLSHAIRWGKANWDILANTQMILGNPDKGEVYGYTHMGKGATLVFLRNPSAESKLIDLPPEVLGVASGATPTSPTAFEIYPAYNPLDWDRPGQSALPVEVPGASTKILAITSDQSVLKRLKF